MSTDRSESAGDRARSFEVRVFRFSLGEGEFALIQDLASGQGRPLSGAEQAELVDDVVNRLNRGYPTASE